MNQWVAPAGGLADCGVLAVQGGFDVACPISSLAARRFRESLTGFSVDTPAADRRPGIGGRRRDELLNSWRFDSLLEARVIIENWRADDNTNRPHSAHGQLTPTEFALQSATTHQPQAA